MAERPRAPHVDFLAIAGRAIPEDGNGSEDAAAEAAVDVLAFLEQRAKELGANPGLTAHLAVLDLSAALLTFNAAANIETLLGWLREQLPARAQELAKAVDASVRLDELPPTMCVCTPSAATWH